MQYQRFDAGHSRQREDPHAAQELELKKRLERELKQGLIEKYHKDIPRLVGDLLEMWREGIDYRMNAEELQENLDETVRGILTSYSPDLNISEVERRRRIQATFTHMSGDIKAQVIEVVQLPPTKEEQRQKAQDDDPHRLFIETQQGGKHERDRMRNRVGKSRRKPPGVLGKW